jgi:hypothetical protein
MENPIKMDDFGVPVPLFQETPKYLIETVECVKPVSVRQQVFLIFELLPKRMHSSCDAKSSQVQMTRCAGLLVPLITPMLSHMFMNNDP